MDHDQAVRTLAVERYLLSEMVPDERDGFEEHYFECLECGESLRAASRFLDDARQVWLLSGQVAAPAIIPVQAGESEVLNPPSKPSSWDWLSWLQPQFAAPVLAVLLGMVGYQAMRNSNLTNALLEASTPHVIRTVALRPQTRGDATTLVAGPGDSVVLQFDLPEPVASAELDVRSESDAVVLRIPGEQHLDQTNVSVSLPGFNLPPGRYNLSVRASGREVARYPLEVRNR
jgi:hypothetical protein